MRAKQERIIETVRQGLEGDNAVEFLHNAGFATTQAGIVRNLRLMGGQGHVQELISRGLSNNDVLDLCLPHDDMQHAHRSLPHQADLFPDQPAHVHSMREDDVALASDIPLYEMTKMTLRLPSDLYEAIGMAARAESKTRNDLVVEILTSALSRMPERLP